MGDKRKKRRPGRPKGPCSPRELAQRRTAAFKHGRYAATPLRKLVHPCRESLCPLADEGGYPCEIKRHADEHGEGLEACLVLLMTNDEIKRAYRDAMAGNPDALKDLTADGLGALHQLFGQEIDSLLTDGLAIEEPIFSKDGEELGVRRVANPAGYPTLHLAKILGLDANAQTLTPKSKGEDKRDRAAGTLLDFIAQKGLSEAGS